MTTSRPTVPRIYVAATRQNDGKTTACIGLMAVLRARVQRLGFIKPVGQRYVEVEGHRIDADAVLMRDVYGCASDLRDMSPIAVDRHFTRRYLENPDPQALERSVCDCFARVATTSDMVAIEGTGHAGVGSVFDLGNARVAELLQAPTIIVACGGIGRPFDEIALNRAVFEKHGVPIIGVLLNKIELERIDEITRYMQRALDRAGLPLLGVIPERPTLLRPSFRHVLDALEGDLLNGADAVDNPVQEIVIGAMTPHRALHYFNKNCLVVTPGDRDDLVLTAVSLAMTTQDHEHIIAGLVLTGGVRPRRSVLQVIKRTRIPVIACAEDTYRVASVLHDMMVKIMPSETQKIEMVQQTYLKYFNVDRLLEYIQ
ncbi:MAG: AAA family ATPase [bacterium]|nr:AAA family ATPase [bacterium]